MFQIRSSLNMMPPGSIITIGMPSRSLKIKNSLSLGSQPAKVSLVCLNS
jgi:hypothetical protein